MSIIPNFLAYLYVSCTSLIVGTLALTSTKEFAGLILFGCVACFIGSTWLIIEEVLKR
jgi:hypothetical protein